jgi:PAS domain S-box-containing protein
MRVIHVLLLEDNALDAELTMESLREGGLACEVLRVDAREAFVAALRDGPIQLILADYSLPSFDGITALELAHQLAPEVPFLFVSGALGEELAIETLKKGATDYVLKHRLERLVPAVRRALAEAEERVQRRRAQEALRESEERFRLLIDSAQDYAIITLAPDGSVLEWNPGAERILGYGRDEVVGRSCSVFRPVGVQQPADICRDLDEAVATGRSVTEGWLVRKDGSRLWASGVMTALRDQSDRLRGFAMILRDLSERKHLEEQLRQRAEQLAQADRRKDEFLAMLGHELRNPLSPIRSAVEVMQQCGLNDPTLQWAHDVIQRQVEHLTRLVDDLLDISRINRDKITLQKQPVTMSQVVNQAVETTRPMLDARRHHLSVRLPAEPLWLDADPTRLTQVLANLLNNAAKYTPECGRVYVWAERQDGEAVVGVRDTGQGIPPDLLPHVFDPFIQADHSLARTQGGLGIGLTLVRRLVEMHGGRVEAHSAGSGTGSEFVIRLPLRAAPVETVNWTAEAEDGTAARARRILLVDDNVDGAQTLALLLQLRGHHVYVVHDGLAAVEAAAAQRPEVVILDIGLPRLDGYQAARRIRRLPGLEKILLLAVTGYGQEEDRERAQQAGFDYHLVKPVDPDVLSQLIARPAGRAGQYV